MAPPRFHAPVEGEPARVTLSAGESAHARRVLRLRDGAEVVLFDGANRELRGRIDGRDDAGRTVVAIDAIEIVDREPPARLTVAVAPPKGKALDDLVRGLAELGADRIVPMATERGVVKLDAARIKIDRLRRAAIEASKQCGRNRITTIDDPRALPAVLAESAAFSLRLRPDVAGAVALRTALPAAPPPSVLALVGPEGGFTEGERALADEAGFVAVSLGRSVCRVATACLALAAVLATAWPVECNGSFDTAP